MPKLNLAFRKDSRGVRSDPAFIPTSVVADDRLRRIPGQPERAHIVTSLFRFLVPSASRCRHPVRFEVSVGRASMSAIDVQGLQSMIDQALDWNEPMGGQGCNRPAVPLALIGDWGFAVSGRLYAHPD
jgi:hypothetical protein